MIEKLSEYKITSRDGAFINAECNTKIINTLVLKINELVDAVNGILDYAPLEMAMKAEPKQADPYTEQRKWIGKLCRFWNFKDGEVDIGILKAIDNLKPAIPYINDIDCSYAYCEPVKPDSELIYHGE